MTTTTTTSRVGAPAGNFPSRFRVRISSFFFLLFFVFLNGPPRPWGGHGRVVRTRGAHVWAARTLPPDNFAKFCSRMKVAREQLLCRGNEKRTGGAGSADAAGREKNENRGLPLHSLFSNRISMSEWVSIVASGEHVCRCVLERVTLT